MLRSTKTAKVFSRVSTSSRCSRAVLPASLFVRSAARSIMSTPPTLPDNFLPTDAFDVGRDAPQMRNTQRQYFVQSGARIGNVYLEDAVLRDVLASTVPAELLAKMEPDLVRFGDRVATQVSPLGAESDRNPPTLLQVDGWGNKVDLVRTSAAWDQLLRIATEEGLMGIGYERAQWGEFARVYQFAKIYMFAGACAVADCPLAMTNGAAKLADEADAETRERCFARLTSRDPAVAVTSGQWMTERTGGSDVARSETLARRCADGDARDYELFGYKYFTSSINSEMAFALARVVNSDGSVTAGSRGLSVFQVETRDANGRLNNIVVHKLKDKLGTKGVPTAELELRGTRARLVGELGRGVPVISTLFNVTRIHNAASSVAYLRRAVAVARDYSYRRSAFGHALADTPLHLATLAGMESEFRGALLMFFDSVRWLGQSEAAASAAEREHAARCLRFATPLLKLYTAKQAVAGTSEGIESLGAHGYMEDSHFPRLLRDAQVLPIWEGTTNVLSLDYLRAVAKDHKFDFLAAMQKRAGAIGQDTLAAAHTVIQSAQHEVAASGNMASARAIAMATSAHYISSLLCEQATRSGSSSDRGVAERWLSVNLSSAIGELQAVRTTDDAVTRSIALDLDDSGKKRAFDGLDTDGRGLPRPRL